jgi:hypothetical protein
MAFGPETFVKRRVTFPFKSQIKYCPAPKLDKLLDCNTDPEAVSMRSTVSTLPA